MTGKCHHSNPTLAAEFARWLSHQRYTRRTQARYNTIVQNLCAFLGAKPLKTVRPLDIHDFLTATLRTSPAETKFRSDLCALRCFFRFLYLGGRVDTVAPWFIRVRRPVFKLPSVLTESETKKLIGAARGLRDRALLELLYATGCRLAEIVAVKIEDIDFQQRKMRVYSKRKERIVYFGASAARTLRQYLNSRKAGYLFVDACPEQKGHLACSASGWEVHWKQYPEGKTRAVRIGRLPEMSRGAARKAMREFLAGVNLARPRRPLGVSGAAKVVRLVGRRAGLIQVVGPRMLRHSFATHMLQRGADIRVIQELLGHTWLTSTQVYTRVSNKRAQADFKRFHPRAA